MSALSSLLVQDQVLTVTQVEQALQRQVIFGGDLATNLLELGLVDEDVLVDYIGRVVRQPVISREVLDSIDLRVIRMVPWHVAVERQIVPVRVHGNTMVVAAAAPPPSGALDELSFSLGVDIAPHLVLEFRLAIALNRYYGARIPARLLALQKRYAPDYEPDPVPVVAPPASEQSDTAGAAGGDPPDAPAPEEPSVFSLPPEPRGAVPAASDQQPIVIESSGPETRRDEPTKRFITAANRERDDTAPFGRPASRPAPAAAGPRRLDRKSTRLNSSHYS